MFTTSAILLPNMSFEELAEQITAITEALELVKNLQPAVEIYDYNTNTNTNTSKSSSSWSSTSAPKLPPQPPVSDLPPLKDNQHPIVLSIWVNSNSLKSYKYNLAKELMDLIREKRQHAKSLELTKFNKNKLAPTSE